PWLLALQPVARLAPLAVTPDGVEREVDAEAAAARVTQGWMECLGPATAHALSSRLGLSPRTIELALLSHEAGGGVLRGHFTPDESPDVVEWCDRRLLARIHRQTLGRLHREIEPVAPATFMRFLFRWQHLHPGTQLHGREGLLEIITQLQGMELPATAWEEHVFPGRIRSYDPADLDHLCLAGRVAWGRLYPGRAEAAESSGDAGRRRRTLTRQAPLAFVRREDLPFFAEAADPTATQRDLGRIAVDLLGILQRRGASFATDLARTLRLLPVQVEAALWELIARSLVAVEVVSRFSPL